MLRMTNVTNNTKTRHKAYRAREIKRLPHPRRALIVAICSKGDQSFCLQVVSLNVPFANVLCRSAKKRYEHCACICLLRSLSHDTRKCDTYVYTSFFQPLIRRKQLGNRPNTYAKRIQKLVNRTLAKRP